MKKIIIFASALALFSACKKDYECECTTNPGNSIDRYTIKGVTKSRAKAACVSTSYEAGGTKFENNCKLK